MFHNIGMYRIFLTRSANQRWDIPEWLEQELKVMM
jgi:hypothetical protein